MNDIHHAWMNIVNCRRLTQRNSKFESCTEANCRLYDGISQLLYVSQTYSHAIRHVRYVCGCGIAD